VSPKRGDLVPAPPVGSEYAVRFGNNDAAKGWEELCRHAAGNVRRCFEAIMDDPRPHPPTPRQHRLEGKLGTVEYRGRTLERWQFEVTGGGRIWYAVDEEVRTVWMLWAGPGHPKLTDLRSHPGVADDAVDSGDLRDLDVGIQCRQGQL
jgi:hypothetical protein